MLERVVEQFRVEEHPRYRPREVPDDVSGVRRQVTFCNVFVWDVTRALACEVPHWWPTGGTLRELSANRVVDWLGQHGLRHGWEKSDSGRAALAAAKGEPALVGWRNPAGGHGHIAVVMPPRPGEAEVMVAQAGAKCSERLPMSLAFGRLEPLHWWTHA
jgi:hypothetical protein